jgi:hypothetical protein
VVDVISASTGAFGLGPYGDEAEHTGPPEVIIITPPYRDFFDTDARSVMITLLPQHYNMIPNPAFRTGVTGWEVTGLGWIYSDDSWVGQSIQCSGEGLIRYKEPDGRLVYVGPLPGTETDQWDSRREGAEWTFSVYFKGSGEVRLKMDAYNPTDRQDLASGPEYQDLITVGNPTMEPVGKTAFLGPEGDVWVAIEPQPTAEPYYESIGRGPAVASVSGEWTAIEDDGDWHRVILKTRARVPDNEGRISFMGARWIDTQIEVRNANPLRVSAAMLDPNEYPTCAYFDGGMTEHLNLDDFLWEGVADNSASYYYFDRVLRTKWLYERMGYVIPAGRPYQIFFGSYWRPYVGKTGETIIMNIPAPVARAMSAVEETSRPPRAPFIVLPGGRPQFVTEGTPNQSG